MAFDIRKDEYVLPKETPSPAAAPAEAAVVEKPSEPVKIVEKKSDDAEVVKGLGVEPESAEVAQKNAVNKSVQDQTDRMKELEKLSSEGRLTEEQQKEYEELRSGIKHSNEKLKNIQKKEEFKVNIGEYKKLEQKGGTDYEKVSRIINKYLTENDEEYNKLSDKEKRAKRDSLIHDWQEIVNNGASSQSLTFAQRQQGFKNIIKIFSVAGASGKDLSEFAKSENLSMLKSHKFEISQMAEILDQVDFLSDQSDDVKILKLADAMLKSDEKYKSLTGKAKEEYLKAKISSYLSDKLEVQITQDDLKNNPQIKFLERVLVDMAGEAQKRGSLESLSKVFENPKLFQRAFLKTMERNQEFIKNLPPEQQKDVKILKIRLEMADSLRSSDKSKVTDKDIYDSLKQKKNLSDEDKELIAFYKNLEKINPKYLDEEADDSKGIVARSILFGGLEEARKRGMAYVNSATNVEDAETRMLNEIKHYRGSSESVALGKQSINEFMKSHPNSKVDFKRKMIEALQPEIAAKINSAPKNKKYIEQAGQLEAFTIEHGTDEQNRFFGKNLNKEAFSEVISHEDVVKVAKNPNNYNNYQISMNAFAQNHTLADQKYLQNRITQIQDSDYKEIATKANIVAAGFEPKRQLELQEYSLNMHDSAVTKGVAAAEKSVDSSVREQYSKNLTNEINEGVKKGYYTQNDVQNFETARQTGQTSSERAQASENSTSTNSSERTNQTSTQAQSSSASSIQGAKVRTETIYISSETKSYANTIKATLAQLDSENKKAEAMKTIAESIAKIQANEIKYEAKVAQQKMQQQKQAVEAAKQENAKKSEEQLKAEQKAATESCVKEIQEELSQSAEAKEIQKYFSDPSWFEKLKSYAKDGQIDQVYQMLAKIPKAQDLFIEKLATKHISTITHFIKTADKSVIKHLVELNPSLIAVLDRNLLLEINIPKATIIKYGDKDQIAGLLSDLQLASTKETLKEFYEVLGVKDKTSDETDASEVVKKNASVKGDDDFISQLQQNMKNASRDYASSGMQGTVVPNWKEPDKKVPREMWG